MGNCLPVPIAYLALVQATGGGLVVSLLHVGDGHALVSSRPYDVCSTVFVGDSEVEGHGRSVAGVKMAFSVRSDWRAKYFCFLLIGVLL